MFKNETILKKINERKALKDQIDALNFKVKELEDALKADLAERGVESYEFEIGGEGHKVSHTTYSKTTLDSKALEKEHPNIYKQFTKTSECTRFSCK